MFRTSVATSCDAPKIESIDSTGEAENWFLYCIGSRSTYLSLFLRRTHAFFRKIEQEFYFSELKRFLTTICF